MRADHKDEELGQPLRHYRNGRNGIRAASEIAIIPLTSSAQEVQPVQLQDKVALIVGGASENGQSLAVAFAERGIDVAIVYYNEKHDLAERIKQQVEARGRRCLLISGSKHDDEEDEEFSQRAVRQILETMGRLDIFINYSAQIFPFRHILEQETQQRQTIRSQIFPHFTMMKAALEQIVS